MLENKDNFEPFNNLYKDALGGYHLNINLVVLQRKNQYLISDTRLLTLKLPRTVQKKL